jgi:hypothetical protein
MSLIEGSTLFAYKMQKNFVIDDCACNLLLVSQFATNELGVPHHLASEL